jgi:hypothetical protein
MKPNRPPAPRELGGRSSRLNRYGALHHLLDQGSVADFETSENNELSGLPSGVACETGKLLKIQALLCRF